MSEGVHVRLSGGLIALAVVHATLLGLVLALLHLAPTEKPQADAWHVPACDTFASAPDTVVVEKLNEPLEVNLQAQGELKQQYSQPICPPGMQAPARVPQQVVNQKTDNPTVPKPAAAPPSGAVQPAAKSPDKVVSPFPNPAGTSAIAAPSPTPAKKNYQLAVFVGDDAQSKRLIEWFDHDPQLNQLLTNCEFQIYTANNPLYQTRFKEIVPIDQFPVVLFQDSTGGHIHAAGRAMIPNSAAELHADLQYGYELYQQAMQAQKTGAIKERGYSWDESITPTMSLSSQDCPDGYCPVEPQDHWRPSSRVRDTLFDGVRDGGNAFIRASIHELATIALSVIAVLLLGFILIKKGL